MIWNWNKKWWNQKKRKREKTTWADSGALGRALYSLGPPPHLFRAARFPFSPHHQPSFYCWRRHTGATSRPHSLVMLTTLISGAHCQLVRPPRNRTRAPCHRLAGPAAQVRHPPCAIAWADNWIRWNHAAAGGRLVPRITGRLQVLATSVFLPLHISIVAISPSRAATTPHAHIAGMERRSDRHSRISLLAVPLPYPSSTSASSVRRLRWRGHHGTSAPPSPPAIKFRTLPSGATLARRLLLIAVALPWLWGRTDALGESCGIPWEALCVLGDSPGENGDRNPSTTSSCGFNRDSYGGGVNTPQNPM
jgi:hypothetical protein